MTATKTKAKAKTSTSVNEDLPANPFAFEILNLVSKQRTNTKKVDF